MEHSGDRNRLEESSSPYLRQHADNPVHWQPWDEMALAEAERREVPILLSIGYSACHWCHVMAHESFEDPATAALVNRGFVPIKVDREERPDLDRIHQTAHQILTQQPGGWPLTVFLDPRTRLPFFSGTYFPNTPRHGMPAFTDLLERVEAVWNERRDELAQQGEKVQEILDALNAPPEGEQAEPAPELLEQARQALGEAWDSSDGGFGSAPKFPMASCLERLLRHWARSGEDGNRRDGEALDMVMHSLTRMARGGIFDHLGGGFCRYATDRAWLVPHFEKMLYDNGALLGLYADAMTIAPDPLLETVVRDTAEWMIREMQAPEGGFHAALDADSEGAEGRFYVWHREQVRRLLDADEYRVVATLYGIDKPANFEGTWILHRRDAWRSVIERLELDPERADALLASARRKLFEAREERVRPERDDKILVAWNGLAIQGLAQAARVVDEPRWDDAATRALDFIRTELMVEGRLHAWWTHGRIGVGGYLEDHALLLEGVLALLARRWRDVDVRFAVTLADALLEHFRDEDQGGFFQTAHDAEDLIHRPKPGMDESLPGGNAAAARALGRLGHLLGHSDYLEAAAGTLRWAAANMARAPQAHCAMLDALEDQLRPPRQILIRGEDAEAWARVADHGFSPGRAVWTLPTEIEPAPGEDAPLLPAWLPDRLEAPTVAWLCDAGSCSLPITSRDGLEQELGENKVVSLASRFRS